MKSTPGHAKQRCQDRTFTQPAPMPRNPCPGGWCVGRRHQEQTYFAIFALPGRLAQLVQSTSFTPRGSGVRVPHRPPRTKHKSPCIAGVFCCPNTHQVCLWARKGSKKPTRPKGGSLCLVLGMPLHWVHRPSHAREVVPLLSKHAPSLLEGGKGPSSHVRPPLNASRSITKDVTHHEQTATHPNHVFARSTRQGASQRFQW